MPRRSAGGYLTTSILFSGSVLIVFAVIGSSQSFHHCIEYAKYHKPYDDTFRSVPIIGHSFRRDQLIIACGAHFIDVHNGLITAIATAIVAAFTFTLWKTTKGLFVSAKEDRELSEKTAERQLRAYVHITESSFQERSGTISIQIRYKNFGLTPADRVMGRNDIKFREYPLITPLVVNTDPMGAVGVLAPGQEHGFLVRLDRILTMPEIEDIKRGKAAVYIYGVFEYLDAFGFIRMTEYRLMVGGPEGPDLTGRLHYEPEGNKIT